MHFIQIGDWIFDSQAQQLSREQQTIQLEPISSTLLYYLCQNSDCIVTRDDLICHVWNNRVVSDSAINRVISMLRKHLADDPQKPCYIRTVHKQGYLLLASMRELSEQESVLHQQKRTSGFFQSLTQQNIVIFLLLCAVGVLIAINSLKSESVQQIKQEFDITPIISKKGQQTNIVLSHNQKWLLYSHKAKNSKFSNLFIKNLKSGKINRLTEGEFNDIGASFNFDDSEIYFARIVKGLSCKIMRIDLVGFSDHIDEEIASCNKRLTFNKVTVLPNNQEIIFRDFQMPYGFALYRYHVINKTYQKVTNINELDKVEWYQNLSPDGNWLITLQSYNSTMEVLLTDMTNESEDKVLWTDRSHGIKSISWSHDSQSIYVKDKPLNKLIKINIYTSKVTPIALDTQLISSLSNQTDSGHIFASHGLNSQKDVVAISLDGSPKQSMEVDSSANDFHALPISEDKLFFISDRAGFSQFYLRGENGVAMQISNFTKNIEFSHLDVHPNGESIIGMAGVRLFSFDINTKLLTWLFEENNNLSLPFYNHQGEIFYLKANKYQQNLYRYVDEKRSELILEDVGIAQWLKNKQDGEDLLYQKSNGVVYRYIVATKQTLQETSGLPFVGENQRMWLGTAKGIYFLGLENRDIYFNPYGSRRASLYYSSEPGGLSNIYYDKFNQRFLMEKLDNDMLTKVVKIDLSSTQLN